MIPIIYSFADTLPIRRDPCFFSPPARKRSLGISYKEMVVLWLPGHVATCLVLALLLGGSCGAVLPLIFSITPPSPRGGGLSCNVTDWASMAFSSNVAIGLTSVDLGVRSLAVWPNRFFSGPSSDPTALLFRNRSLLGSSVLFNMVDAPNSLGSALSLKLTTNGTLFSSSSTECTQGAAISLVLLTSAMPTLSPSLLTVSDGFTVAFWFRDVSAAGGSSGIILMVTDTTTVAANKLSTRQALTSLADCIVMSPEWNKSAACTGNKIASVAGMLSFAIYMNSSTREIAWISSGSGKSAGVGPKLSFINRLDVRSSTVSPTTLAYAGAMPNVDVFDGSWHRIVITVAAEPSIAGKAVLQLYLDGQTFGGSVDYRKCVDANLVVPTVEDPAYSAQTAQWTTGYLDQGQIELYDVEVHLAVLTDRNIVALGSPSMTRYLPFSLSSSLLCAAFAFCASVFILVVAVYEFRSSTISAGSGMVSEDDDDELDEAHGGGNDEHQTLVSSEQAAGAVAGEMGKLAGTAKAVTRTLRNTASATSSRASKASSGGGLKKAGNNTNANLSASISVPIRQFCLKLLPQIIGMFQTMGLYFKMMTWPSKFSSVFKTICLAVAVDVSSIPIPIWLYPVILLASVVFLAYASSKLATADDLLFRQIVVRYEMAVAASVELLVDQLRGELSRSMGRTSFGKVPRTALRDAAFRILCNGRTNIAITDALRALRRDVKMSFPLHSTSEACAKAIATSCTPQEPLEALIALFLRRALIPATDIPDVAELAIRLLTTGKKTRSLHFG